MRNCSKNCFKTLRLQAKLLQWRKMKYWQWYMKPTNKISQDYQKIDKNLMGAILVNQQILPSNTCPKWNPKSSIDKAVTKMKKSKNNWMMTSYPWAPTLKETSLSLFQVYHIHNTAFEDQQKIQADIEKRYAIQVGIMPEEFLKSGISTSVISIHNFLSNFLKFYECKA